MSANTPLPATARELSAAERKLLRSALIRATWGLNQDDPADLQTIKDWNRLRKYFGDFHRVFVEES